MNETSHLYDLIVIGAGPAGITAAIYAARKKMDFVVLTTNVGGQVVWTSQIENYTGFQYISGEELSAKFKEHLKQFGFKVHMEEAQSVEKRGDSFEVATANAKYQGRTLIVATGRKPNQLGIPGEAEYKNRGVAYCATCDGPFFEDLDVAVTGGGNSGLEAVAQLVKIAKRIHLIEIGNQLKADPLLVERARASGKVEILTNTKPIEIVGDRTVTGIRVLRDGKEILIPVQGVFVEVGSRPNSELVSFVEKGAWGEIVVNCRCETNVPGLFAAGDVTNVPEKQIVVAAGEGCKAALSAFRFLTAHEFA